MDEYGAITDYMDTRAFIRVRNVKNRPSRIN